MTLKGTQKKYKTLFFDLDRTLWDFDANSLVALEILYSEFDLEKRIPRFEKFVKVYEKENFRLWSMYRDGKVNKDDVSIGRFSRTLNHFGDTRNIAEQMAERYLEALSEQTILFPNTIDVLIELKEHCSLGIITNGFEEVQQKKMKNSGLSPYFDFIVTSENAGVLKPQPAIFEAALQQAGSNINEALMIGDDHKADILGAKKMGIDQAWFLPNQDKRGDATYYIKDLKELLTIVRQ